MEPFLHIDDQVDAKVFVPISGRQLIVYSLYCKPILLADMCSEWSNKSRKFFSKQY